jgi:putative acetyltransferase
LKPQTWVLERDKTIIAFCGLGNDGHIVSLYVHPLFSRQGYGTKLLNFVLAQGLKAQINRFYTEASFLSQPVFSRAGFTVVAREIVKYDEILFERYKMEK